MDFKRLVRWSTIFSMTDRTTVEVARTQVIPMLEQHVAGGVVTRFDASVRLALRIARIRLRRADQMAKGVRCEADRSH